MLKSGVLSGNTAFVRNRHVGEEGRKKKNAKPMRRKMRWAMWRLCPASYSAARRVRESQREPERKRKKGEEQSVCTPSDKQSRLKVFGCGKKRKSKT